ncbi:Variant surface glycoprotein [Trypanosoma congolense IL3000]|uniref:Variant surface glycoprotein n=1 Tax=Trypanosoma congolense (strain IL3000) TaxID=1068625 RepID=F9W8A7_TRYCI|nr:Variant surface glycoprotein [Trypanosoma congolense IL3000]
MWGKIMALMVLLSVRCLGDRGYDDGIFSKLCDVVRKTRALYRLQEANSTVKKTLEQAIYGTQTTALFNDDGNVEISGNCGSQKMRNLLCTYHSGGLMMYGKGGCFAESLLGTIMCVCTPGSFKSNIGSLCGADTKKYNGKTWWGRWLDSKEQKELIKEVWEEVKENCPEDGGYKLQDEEKLNDLKRSLDTLRETLKPTIGLNLFYLGGSGWGGCSGSNGDSVCALYKGNVADKKSVNIPWMTKIVTTLEDLSKTLATQAGALAVTASAHSTPEAAGVVPDNRENAENAETAVQIKHSADETNEDIGLLKTKFENSGKSESSVVESSKARTTGENRTTPQHHLTEIPHITTNPNEEGSLIIKQFSFLCAALLL